MRCGGAIIDGAGRPWRCRTHAALLPESRMPKALTAFSTDLYAGKTLWAFYRKTAAANSGNARFSASFGRSKIPLIDLKKCRFFPDDDIQKQFRVGPFGACGQ